MEDEELNEIEEQEESEEDSENDINMEDYTDYPFAMEIVNGEIINLSAELQTKILQQLIKKAGLTKKKFVQYLRSFCGEYEDEEGEEEEIENEFLADFDSDFLMEILAFDPETGTFSPDGIGFLDSQYGYETKELLESLDYALEEEVNEGPHGHGSYGVYYLEQI